VATSSTAEKDGCPDRVFGEEDAPQPQPLQPRKRDGYRDLIQ